MHLTFSDLGDTSGKEPTCQCRRHRFDPGSGKSPGVGNGNVLQYSCQENSMEKGTQQAAVHGVAKSWTHERISVPTTL